MFELISWSSLLLSRARSRRQGERQANDFDDVLTDEEIKQFQLKVFQQPVRDSGGRPAGLRTARGGRRVLKDSCGVRSIRSPRVSLFCTRSSLGRPQDSWPSIDTVTLLQTGLLAHLGVVRHVIDAHLLQKLVCM